MGVAEKIGQSFKQAGQKLYNKLYTRDAGVIALSIIGGGALSVVGVVVAWLAVVAIADAGSLNDDKRAEVKVIKQALIQTPHYQSEPSRPDQMATQSIEPPRNQF